MDSEQYKEVCYKMAAKYRECAGLIRQGWSQGALARDADWQPVEPESENACAWSPQGALQRIFGPPSWNGQHRFTYEGFVKANNIAENWIQSIGRWNNAVDRTAKEVEAAFLVAAEFAEFSYSYSINQGVPSREIELT